MTLLNDLRDANEARILGELLARQEGYWGLTEARLSALVPKPTALLERVGSFLRRVRVARAVLYPRIGTEDVRTFTERWTPEEERRISLMLLGEEQRLTEVGVSA